MNLTLWFYKAQRHGWRVVTRGGPPSGKPYSPAPPITLLLGAAILLMLSGCGGPTAGDPEAGRKLFNGEELIADGNLDSCNSCHADTVDGQSRLGPNLSNIGLRAGRTVPGQSTEDYLRTSIIDPDAFLSGGFQEGIMPRDYGRALTPQQINDLIAYMETLRSGVDE
ncbi:MAG TPA: c-type cytochrome [Roseiflexaceae bacterium]|nr:c-type cytochrome [Roseiflexaceae bacterium]